jgi:hypothetical protein
VRLIKKIGRFIGYSSKIVINCRLNAKLSEANRLVIELYDYDDIFPNELIGTTVIDIEDRYYDSNWRNLKHKPIELRSIRDPDLPEEQAQLLMWLEVYDKSKRSEVPIWDITPPPEMVCLS